MDFTTAVSKLEQDKSLVMYRKNSGGYIHLTDGFALSASQIKEATGVVYQAVRMGRMLLAVVDGLARPFHPSSDEMFANDWQVKPAEVPDAVPTATGAVVVPTTDEEYVVRIMQDWGYGEFVSGYNLPTGDSVMYFDSRLFRVAKSGEATPQYRMIVDEVERSIRVEELTTD